MMKALMLLSFLFAASLAQARPLGSFPDSTDFPVIIQQAFKRLTGVDNYTQANIVKRCLALTLDNKTVLADFDVLTGFPSSTSINAPFWKWYFGCIEVYSAQSVFVSEQGLRNTLGVLGSLHFAQKSYTEIRATVWQTLPPDVRMAISKSMTNTLIRDDLLIEFGTKTQDIVSEINLILDHPSRSGFKLDQALMVILQTVFKQKSFLLE
jgi:hypothetical protein